VKACERSEPNTLIQIPQLTPRHFTAFFSWISDEIAFHWLKDARQATVGSSPPTQGFQHASVRDGTDLTVRSFARLLQRCMPRAHHAPLVDAPCRNLGK
jgi:hypothetical protein